MRRQLEGNYNIDKIIGLEDEIKVPVAVWLSAAVREWHF